jgi:integrase
MKVVIRKLESADCRMGYKGRATVHGFRATASTTLNEMSYNPDAIERQLAHIEQNKVKAAYNRSDYLSQRITLMVEWSDLLSEWSNAN